MRMLVAWIGNTDLGAPDRSDKDDLGPIAQALNARPFDAALLLANQERSSIEKYERWLRAGVAAKLRGKLTIIPVELSSPINFDEIYSAVTQNLSRALGALTERPELTFHLSSGTPAMAATWVILGKTRYQAELIQSSRQRGVETASLPFDISLSPEFVADVLRIPDKKLEDLTAGTPDAFSQFGDIIYLGKTMQRLVDRAKKAAPRSVGVLIEGESGTGKELLARAIHNASLRKDKAFQVVNCGAIPSELVDSELFGHMKGSFTGAAQDHIGFFEAAHQGTLFLDEIGELPLAAQVKLLRTLQDGEVRRVGDTRTRKVDVRVIAATNRDLISEVAAGNFREDLFYRLAILVLRAPPLREREGDINPLIDGLLNRINQQSEDAKEPGFKRKVLSLGARKLLTQHTWPGNIRELENTLRRAAVWSDGEVISLEDMKEAFLPNPETKPSAEAVLNRPLAQGIDLQEIIASVGKHYLQRAMEATNRNKSKAAAMLGLPSHQTLTNWLQKYGVE